LEAILKGEYSASSHHAVAYDRCMKRRFSPSASFVGGECTGGTTIIKHDYEIDYVNVDSKGRKNRQCR
jgi:hypothetical protein